MLMSLTFSMQDCSGIEASEWHAAVTVCSAPCVEDLLSVEVSPMVARS